MQSTHRPGPSSNQVQTLKPPSRRCFSFMLSFALELVENEDERERERDGSREGRTRADQGETGKCVCVVVVVGVRGGGVEGARDLEKERD